MVNSSVLNGENSMLTTMLKNNFYFLFTPQIPVKNKMGRFQLIFASTIFLAIGLTTVSFVVVNFDEEQSLDMLLGKNRQQSQQINKILKTFEISKKRIDVNIDSILKSINQDSNNPK